MSKYLIGAIFSVLLFSCNNQDPKEQLSNINGYWEIEKVEFSKDSVRQFKMSEIVDYIEVDNGDGFRKKVKPRYDGTFIEFGDAEKLEAKIEEDQLILYYSTPFNSWKETVIKGEKDNMSIKNERGYIYHYKRYTPLLKDYNEEKK
jgi:3'-phosphoadenosine 5'-phosphosulfate sulfotransferase